MSDDLKRPLLREWRYLLPAWLICTLLPSTLVFFWHTPYGRSSSLALFCLCCASLVAFSFRRDIRLQTDSTATQTLRPHLWRERILPLSIALASASSLFSTVSLVMNDSHDFAIPLLAFMALVPALGIVPYMVLLTRNAIAGVIFSALLVGSMKTPIGANIVRIFFPSHFQQDLDIDGSLIMPTPWLHPNLLVWFFYASVAALSILFCFRMTKKLRNASQIG